MKNNNNKYAFQLLKCSLLDSIQVISLNISIHPTPQRDHTGLIKGETGNLLIITLP